MSSGNKDNVGSDPQQTPPASPSTSPKSSKSSKSSASSQSSKASADPQRTKAADKSAAYTDFSPSIPLVMAGGQPSQEATTMVNTTPVDQATGSDPPDLFTHLEIDDWKPDIIAKIEQYAGLGRLDKFAAYHYFLPSIPLVIASGQPSQEATTMVNTTPVDQATGSDPPDLSIHLEIDHWKPNVLAKVEEYAGIGRLESQKYKVACDYEIFQSDMVDCGIPAKFEYLYGFAEITVFASTIIHNAIGTFPWDTWVRTLPDHPTLQVRDVALPGLNVLLNVDVDSLTTYKVNSSDDKKADLAADMQIGTFLNDEPQKAGIIIEVAYSESFKHAKVKAKEYLFADKPRPSVVVIFNYTQKQSDKEYRNIDLKFEVLRRHETIPGDLEVFEQGYAWPPEKANTLSNTQYITFSLEEIFGNLKVIKRGLEIQQDLSKAPSRYHLSIFEKLPCELLIRLKEKVEMDEVAKLPISYITEAVQAKLEAQKGQDGFVAEIQGKKPKRDEDLRAEQEQTFRRR